MTPERLADIDRELDGFGKSADVLAGVVARARALAAGLEGDEALGALLAEAASAAAQAADRTRAALEAAAPVRPPIREHVPVQVKKAPRTEPLGFDDDEPDTSVMSALSVERGAAKRKDSSPPHSSDIAGLSVDELFADAEPSGPAQPAGSGLADLFDEDEVVPVQEPASDGGLADLFEAEASAEPTAVGNLADLFGESEELRLSDPELEAEAVPSAAPPADTFLDPFSDEDDEVTGHFSAEAMARIERAAQQQEAEAEDDFELLVDDDVLELDEVEEITEGDDEPEQPKKPGLFGRLLGKK